ncbi:Bug family tripartite tricarboxylate transporter substrate binding protein [Pararoseomonas indoligenes]|uniref:Tripartite tricarboxylate transporter substrate binding protein n=1 Tax=Roseomonas indoligenes TaxID=2820811 RepID=A0A940S630_9PROT|nr:tripartite tricarboxylate transporter substrate binding protein [Pararoseomonas indoligenes]MBP0491622.1 tripartite tricarboxylate transporter substrate binding protein [Pararoseomonas indoligenes]
MSPDRTAPTRRALLAGAAVAALAPAAHAQETWPSRPVRVIVPFPPGGTPDTAARALVPHLSEAFGQPFVVDNRSGAGGNLGTDLIAKARDGHTIGVSINGPLVTAPALYSRLPYDPAADLTYLSQLVRGAQLLVVHPSVPAQNLASFVAYAKANPGVMSFGSVGPGSAGHLAMEELKARLGIDLVHVPYRGFPEATVDLVAGRIQAMIQIAAGIIPQVQDGKARALAVTADARLAKLPDVPTLAEAGVPDAASYAWIGLVAPVATPAGVAARLAAETRTALAEPRVRGVLEGAGFEVVASTPQAFTELTAAERQRWAGLIRRLGITADG